MIEQTLCPVCGGKMLRRTNRSNGQAFWGCARYPDCRGTRNTDGEARREHQQDDDALSPGERARSNDRRRWEHQ